MAGRDRLPAPEAALALAVELAPQARLHLVHAAHAPYPVLGYEVAGPTMPEARCAEMRDGVAPAIGEGASREWRR